MLHKQSGKQTPVTARLTYFSASSYGPLGKRLKAYLAATI